VSAHVRLPRCHWPSGGALSVVPASGALTPSAGLCGEGAPPPHATPAASAAPIAYSLARERPRAGEVAGAGGATRASQKGQRSSDA
jgi:hypothetical protein